MIKKILIKTIFVLFLISNTFANANDIAKHFTDNAQKAKRPHDIYHVTEHLYFSGPNKFQRSKLPAIVKNSFPPHIISKVNVKDYSEV